MALFIAVLLRFWLLGQWPPGLYRDEAFNGLDALRVLQGEHALFFAANNGREPAYIYLTAAAIAAFGRTALAVRLAAAVAGVAATVVVYLLGASWYGRRVGLLGAWVWAITLWPVHLSRIGLRVILLAPLLGLTFWLGTLAYRRQRAWLWLLSGLVYGAGFYTYLAARFTPVLLALLLLYLLATGRGRRLWPGVGWFVLGAAVALLPLGVVLWQQPDLVLGRTGQVSIFHPDVSGGNPLGTLLRQTAAALGMFLWRGDTILRHNPAGRPVFDLFLAVPFLIGLLWCLRWWRRPAAAAALLWTGVMLGPTILAADTPHFLRAAGVLPVIVFFPALGLAQIAQWPRLAPAWRAALVVVLLGGSLFLTVRDYAAYSRDPEVAYYFEAAARDLGEQINAEAPETAVFLDERLWSAWPPVSFLVIEPGRVQRLRPEETLPEAPGLPATLYAWPYESLDFVPRLLPPPALVRVTEGPLARGDLEETPYPLFVRYAALPLPAGDDVAARFAGGLQLRQAEATVLPDGRLQVEAWWQGETAVAPEPVIFVHVIGPEGQLVGQADGPPADGRWPLAWWQPGYVVADRRLITLPEAYDPALHRIRIGLYDPVTGERAPLLDESGAPSAETAYTVE